MAAVVKAWAGAGQKGLHFFCPGCNEVHGITSEPQGWTWNGDLIKPTFSPSILVTAGHYMPTYKSGDRCWCTFDAEQAAKGAEISGFKCMRCHSFVREGRIEFLNDCTHAMAGQTVDMPPWQEE